MRFTYYTIIGKDVNLIKGHLSNIKYHAGFDKLTCEKEIIVIVYKNNKIPETITSDIINVCCEMGARVVEYKELCDNFLINLYACWNLGYEKADDGFVFRAGSDQIFNRNAFVNLYNVAMSIYPDNPKTILQAQTIENATRTKNKGAGLDGQSRHLTADLGDSFENLDLAGFEKMCEKINQNVDKKLLTIDECLEIWGKPTPFKTSLGVINRTEGCSWLMTKKEWETYGPLPVMEKGITGDCYIHDILQLHGYKDYLVRDCITYHFFRGESGGVTQSI